MHTCRRVAITITPSLRAKQPQYIYEYIAALTISALPATVHTLLWTQRYHYHISRDSYTITKLTNPKQNAVQSTRNALRENPVQAIQQYAKSSKHAQSGVHTTDVQSTNDDFDYMHLSSVRQIQCTLAAESRLRLRLASGRSSHNTFTNTLPL